MLRRMDGVFFFCLKTMMSIGNDIGDSCPPRG